MKKKRTRFGNRGGVALVALLALVLGSTAALAEINTGRGDIAGSDDDLTDSNDFVLNSTTLALVKRAFLEDGTPLASNSSVPKGTIVQFMIYINNQTPVDVADVTIQDVLDPLFTYQAGTIEIDNTATCASDPCTALEEDAIYLAVKGSGVISDAVDANVASFNGTDTIDVGDGNQGAPQTQLDIDASAVFAVLFSARVD